MPRKAATSASRAQELISIVNKHLGTDTLTTASDPRYKVSSISTGLLPMDILLGGGLPRGRFVECYGDFSTLKTYVGMSAIRVVQESGGTAAVIDTEHTFDESWARKVGIKVEDLIISRPETGEEGIDAAEVLALNGVDLIVFDSIAATLPQDEAGKRLATEKVQPGRQAALMSLACRKLTTANKFGTSFFWINQTRQKIGVTFGSNESFPGGRAMQYYASYRIRMQKIGTEKDTKKVPTGRGNMTVREVVAQKFLAEVTKSKLSKPFREIYFEWDLTTGSLDTGLFLIAQCLEHGIIKQSGAFYTLPDGDQIRGAQNVKWHFDDHPELVWDLEARVRQLHDLPGPAGARPRPKQRRPLRKPRAAAKKG